MKFDKLKIYTLQILFIIFVFFTLFASNISSRILLSIFIFIYMFVVLCLLKRRIPKSIFEKQVNILMVIFGILYVTIYYLLGLYFGFVKSKIMLSWWSILRFIIPLSLIVYSSERIRYTFLTQKIKIQLRRKKFDLAKLLTFILMVLIDLNIYTGVYDLTNLPDFLLAFGFVLCASISCNLLYNYLSIRYGYRCIVIFKLITLLYSYFIPVEPNVYIFLRSFLRMIYPYIIYLILESTYSKKIKGTSKNQKKKSFLTNSVIIIISILLIMLISCEFKYGILVIGSKSMTGTINKGDAVIFEQYKNQKIPEGQIIIFDYNGIKTVHRVVEIEKINGEYIYYTKGDANEDYDSNYRTNNDISGLVKLKVKYIGYPTLWLRNLFN